MSKAEARRPASGPTALVVMGVAGSGKSTVGRIVAERLGWRFLDADDFHPAGSRAKMRGGEPLTDAEREPWLAAVGAAVAEVLRGGQSVVLACSALRPSHRKVLTGERSDIVFAWLDAPQDVLRRRLRARAGHFAGENLLQSQLETLELGAPGNVERVEGSRDPSEVADDVIALLS